MDIPSDIAAIQTRIAQITGADAVPAVAPVAPPADTTPGVQSAFTTYLQQMMAQPSGPVLPSMLMPVSGEITSPFGQRDNPMGQGTEFHPGIDIAAAQGTPIAAAMAGTVVAAGPDGGYGNLITVDDGNGLTTRYAHCSQIYARVGERVAPGDVIGAVGMTGRATGPHLHFEVRQDDRAIDPSAYLNRRYAVTSSATPSEKKWLPPGMKILIVGAAGTIGSAVVNELKGRNEIVTAGRKSGDFTVDTTDLGSVRAMFEKIGPIDAVVSNAGNVHFGPLLQMTPEQLQLGLTDKLMGQVHLALEATKHLNPGGSVTLTAGTLSKDPIRFGASASLVNAALEGFVRAAALEFPPGMRINAVSPTVLAESMAAYGPYFPGSEGVPAKRVALAFAKSVEGAQTGQVYFVE